MSELNTNSLNNFLEAFRSGREEGFTYFFKAYHKSLCFFAGRYVPVTNAALDIVEDSFIRLWAKREKFDTEVGLRSYLYKTVYHACLRWLEQEKRKSTHLQSFQLLAEKEEQSCLHNMIRAETHRHLHFAIQQLPTQCRKIFFKLYVEEKSVAETADELSLSNSTIKAQKARGIKLLKLKLT